MTASSLQALRAGAQGIYVLEAATDLIIAQGTWSARDDFRSLINPGAGMAAINWEAVTRALNAGELPSSAGENRMRNSPPACFLPEMATNARLNGHSWDEIARAIGTGPEEAHLRFDPESLVADLRWPYDF